MGAPKDLEKKKIWIEGIRKANTKERFPVECSNCGEILYRLAWELKGKKHSFCNQKCKGGWQIENLVGENNPVFGRKHSVEERANIKLHHADVSGKKNPMFGVHLKGERSGGWRGGPIYVICADCGREIPKGRNAVRNSGSARFFCDKKCCGRWLKKNQVAWNIGLTKETDERVRRYAEKESKTQKEKFKNKENHPMFGRHHKLVSRQKQRKARKEHWEKMSREEREEFNKLRFLKTKPNKKELRLIEFFRQNEFPYEFVGAGKVWINGKNPDFINTDGKQKLIEFFGVYFHKEELPENGGDNGRARQKIFEEKGYSVLIIWEHELDDLEKLFLRVVRFEKCKEETFGHLEAKQ